jgi:molybdenum cofactor cytidylyltransferase
LLPVLASSDFFRGEMNHSDNSDFSDVSNLAAGPQPDRPRAYAGILLAAGKGRRFDPAGIRNKLLQRLPDGDTVVAQAAKNLQAALGKTLAVVPSASPLLVAQLAALGLEATECGDADSGMAASLMHGLRATQDAAGWVIALGDMPFVRPDTMRRIVAALAQGAGIAVPVYHGVRGNPVGFGRIHLERLLQLSGDVGARKLLQQYPVLEIAVDDPGVCRDIDTVPDLQESWTENRKPVN